MSTEEDNWIDHIVLSREQSYDQLLPILQLICLVEQIYVPKEILTDIINFCKFDIRKILLQLHFWFDQGKQPLFSLRNNSSKSNVGQNKTKDPCTTRASLETANDTNNRNVDVAVAHSEEETERIDRKIDKTNSITTELQIEYGSLDESYFGNHKEQFFDKNKVTF